ncbi:MAG: tetratricopeptide repeat protein [Chthoniobacterales bacterium]
MKTDNFFAELRRRNVYKVAIAYIVAGWALSQGIAQVLPVFDVPNWAIRLIVLLIIVGFPIAVVLAWAFELTPQGIKRTETADAMPATTQRRKHVWIYIVAIGAALSIGLFFLGRYSASRAAIAGSERSLAVAGSLSQKSIAVLPFSDLSPNHDQESFSDGMAEEILNALAHIKDLKVVGRASSFFYKGKNVNLKQIGSELGVANILEGSVRKQDEQVRITAALSRTADGLQVWSKNYNGTLANIFDLQESFARDIAAELNLVLADPSQARLVEKSTDNAQAYTLFVEAQTLVSRRVGDSLPRAIALLKEATRLDPKFSRAWAKLVVALAVEPQYSNADWETNWAAADQAAHQAIELDPKSAEAYAALGYIDFSRRRYREMVEPAERAISIDPNDVTANFWLANQLAATGRTVEAEAVNDRALNADPGNALIVYYKGTLRWRQGDKDTTLKLANRTKALGSPLAGLLLCEFASREGHHDRAAEQFSTGFSAFRTGFSKEDLGAIYGGVFGGEAARKAALAVVARNRHDQFAGTLLLLLGEPEQSFVSFERDGVGVSDAYLNFLWLPEDYARKARRHPAFQSFAKRIGLVDYWKQNRWPDLCQPTPERGADTFTCQ